MLRGSYSQDFAAIMANPHNSAFGLDVLVSRESLRPQAGELPWADSPCLDSQAHVHLAFSLTASGYH